MSPSELAPLPLPEGVSSHYIRSPANDLTYHFLSAGRPGDPLVLLYHGFPEMSFCWRFVLPLLAGKGYYAVAPDTRGSGRTTSSNPSTSVYTEGGEELRAHLVSASVRDAIIFVKALGYDKVHCLVGHDAGAVLVAWIALTRPDMIQRLVVASHPYSGTPSLPTGLPIDEVDRPGDGTNKPPAKDVHAELLELPQPRKHYKWFYSGPDAAADLEGGSREELRSLLAGYYYLKSASWPGNKPHPLEAWNGEQLAKMPFYYIMPADCGMREAVARQLGGEEADCDPWIGGAEMEALAGEWRRTGFQGALNWYRVMTDPGRWQRDLQAWSGAKLAMPMVMLLGREDWGSYQVPGALEKVGDKCEKYLGERWIEKAGHWMQQEKPQEVAACILEMCQQ